MNDSKLVNTLNDLLCTQKTFMLCDSCNEEDWTDAADVLVYILNELKTLNKTAGIIANALDRISVDNQEKADCND